MDKRAPLLARLRKLLGSSFMGRQPRAPALPLKTMPPSDLSPIEPQQRERLAGKRS